MLCRYIIVMMRTSFDETIVKLYQEKQTTNEDDDDDDGFPLYFNFISNCIYSKKLTLLGGLCCFTMIAARAVS